MIKSIRVITVGTSSKREYLSVNYSDTSPFLVTNLDGVNPPDASVNFTESVFKDGSYYNSYTINNRNLVISLDFIPTSRFPTVEHVRKKAYELFPPGIDIELEFVTDTIEKPVYIKGYIEKHETSLFTDRPGSVVSILCPQPYFYERDHVTMSSETNSFDFYSYAGTAPSPITFKKTFTEQTGSFTIGRSAGQYIRLDRIPANSVLEVSFDPDNRYIKLTNNGQSLPAYNYLIGGDLSVTVSNTQGHVSMYGHVPGVTGFEIKFRKMYLGL